MRNKKSPPPETVTGIKITIPIENNHNTAKYRFITVQASASQGSEIALGHALVSTFPANQLIVSPPFRGSNPYPCGSLTYRVLLFRPYHMLSSSFCQLFCCKSDFIFIIFLLFHQNRRNVIILLVVASYNKSFISPPACLLEVLGLKDQDGNQY